MIHTTFEDIEGYCSIHSNFKMTFDALKRVSSEAFAKGKHPVDDFRVFINALEYNTKNVSDSLMEAHRRYIDVMLMLEGEEKIGYMPFREINNVVKEYSEAGDSLMAGLEEGCSWITMKAGDVAIFFPEEAHAPGVNLKAETHVRKLIAKVLFEKEKRMN